VDRSASMLELKALRVPQGQAIAVWIFHKAAKNLPEAPDEKVPS